MDWLPLVLCISASCRVGWDSGYGSCKCGKLFYLFFFFPLGSSNHVFLRMTYPSFHMILAFQIQYRENLQTYATKLRVFAWHPVWTLKESKLLFLIFSSSTLKMSSQATNDHDLVIWKRTFPHQKNSQTGL